MRPFVVIMRHAEKEIGGRAPFGVTIDGTRDSASLTPRGWQRAGALIGLFVPRPEDPGPRLTPTPTRLFACRPGDDNTDSRRPLETLEPLGERLGIRVEDGFGRRQLDEVATAIVAADGVVVVAWEHKMIPSLTLTLAGHRAAIPDSWPEDRFDLAWILEPDDAGGGYAFRQTPQLLLSGDLERVI